MASHQSSVTPPAQMQLTNLQSLCHNQCCLATTNIRPLSDLQGNKAGMLKKVKFCRKSPVNPLFVSLLPLLSSAQKAPYRTPIPVPPLIPWSSHSFYLICYCYYYHYTLLLESSTILQEFLLNQFFFLWFQIYPQSTVVQIYQMGNSRKKQFITFKLHTVLITVMLVIQLTLVNRLS